MRNGPEISRIHQLPLGADAMVWREKKNWTVLYKLLVTKGEQFYVKMPTGSVTFRSVVGKPYKRNMTNFASK